jgi:hypothetical protein
MSAAEVLKAARAACIRLGIDGDALTLEAAAAPPPAVLDLLSRHKARIVALLRPVTAGRPRIGWRFSTNGWASPSSMAGCRANKPKPVPSPVAWPNG